MGLIAPKPVPQSVREVIDRHYPAFEVSQPGQLQQLDLVGPRYLQGRSQKYYFYNLRDVCSRRVAVEVGKNHQAFPICQALIRSWQRLGMPTILQHDNALEFRGSNQYPRTAGLLTKLCVALQIESVFVPAHEPYRNGTIENFNGLFQRLVLQTSNTLRASCSYSTRCQDVNSPPTLNILTFLSTATPQRNMNSL